MKFLVNPRNLLARTDVYRILRHRRTCLRMRNLSFVSQNLEESVTLEWADNRPV